MKDTWTLIIIMIFLLFTSIGCDTRSLADKSKTRANKIAFENLLHDIQYEVDRGRCEFIIYSSNPQFKYVDKLTELGFKIKYDEKYGWVDISWCD